MHSITSLRGCIRPLSVAVPSRDHASFPPGAPHFTVACRSWLLSPWEDHYFYLFGRLTFACKFLVTPAEQAVRDAAPTAFNNADLVPVRKIIGGSVAQRQYPYRLDVGNPTLREISVRPLSRKSSEFKQFLRGASGGGLAITESESGVTSIRPSCY